MMTSTSIRFMLTSIQEELVEIRPVNRNVTANTFAHRGKTQTAMRHIGSLRIHVALKAQKTPFTTNQKHARNTPMGIVAGDTSFHFHCSVFENEGAALLDMTVDATFPVGPPKHWFV